MYVALYVNKPTTATYTQMYVARYVHKQLLWSMEHDMLTNKLLDVCCMICKHNQLLGVCSMICKLIITRCMGAYVCIICKQTITGCM